jgi:hypothetical protein
MHAVKARAVAARAFGSGADVGGGGVGRFPAGEAARPFAGYQRDRSPKRPLDGRETDLMIPPPTTLLAGGWARRAAAFAAGAVGQEDREETAWPMTVARESASPGSAPSGAARSSARIRRDHRDHAETE